MPIRNLVHWDRPFNIPVRQRNRFGRSLISLQDDMNNLFQDFFGNNITSDIFPGYENFPAVNIIENGKSFKIKAALSGLDPDDITVSVTNGFLIIKGKHEEEKEEKDENYLHREISSGSFQRTIALPEGADGEKADASFKNGILEIKLPKKAEAVQEPKNCKSEKRHKQDYFQKE